MLIEELIRLGRPLLGEGGFAPNEILALVADTNDPRVRNFYRHVYVVELPAEGGAVQVLPLQVWGVVGEKDKFTVDPRAAGAPVALPGGGNPIHPQGHYPTPAYPVYGKHFGWMAELPQGVDSFLRGRLEKTAGEALTTDELAAVSTQLHRRLVADGASEDWLGVLVLAREGGLYRFADSGAATRSIGRTADGREIVPDAGRILEGVWAARYQEGASAGHKQGVCFVTGSAGEVVAPYCTAWPWAFLTWKCPLPNGGSTELLTDGLGLSEPAYRALVLGACAFRRLTRLVRPWLTHELFAPATDRVGRNAAQRRNLSDLDPVYGAALALPVQDATLADPEYLDGFVNGLKAQLGIVKPEKDQKASAERHLDSVTGFDCVVPEDMAGDDYRLTLVYFSGDVSRGDIHLRAMIPDVLPSVAHALGDLANGCAETGVRVLLGTKSTASAEQQTYLRTRFRSVPYLLARAYGGPHLWAQLESAMHRRRLERARITAQAAARLASLTPKWPASRFDVADEVVFYLTALAFAARHNAEIALQPEELDMPMRPWPELLDAIERGPIDEMNLRADDPAELGFACGVVTGQFRGWYWGATKVGGQGKDFLEHRVLTFGSDLSPAAVKSALKLALELPKRMPHRKPPKKEKRRRVAVVLCELENRAAQLKADRDGFLAAFWCGYTLQGANDPPRDDKKKAEPVTAQPLENS